MTNKNPITGDTLATKPATVQFRNGYDKIQWKPRCIGHLPSCPPALSKGCEWLAHCRKEVTK